MKLKKKHRIFFHYLERAPLSNRSSLKVFIEQIFKKEKKKLQEVHYIFCSDSYLLEINRQFLRHDFYTDIITFDLSEGLEISAEIYISIDRVKENAAQLEIPFLHELHRVMIHGVLHLCGYKDKSPRDIKLMRQREDHYLRKLNDFRVNH